jgi:hypothetical protein
MSVQIRTQHLLTLLGDLVHTASNDDYAGAAKGVLLHTDRGYLGDEPGMVSLLIGSSTNGRAAAQAYVPCDGTFREPMLWQLDDIRTIVTVLKPKIKDNKDHMVTIARDLSTCTVQEPSDLFGDGNSFTFHLGDLDKYPRYVWGLLDYEEPEELPQDGKGGFIPVAARTDVTAGMLSPFVAVAKSRTAEIQLYRSHQDRPIMVQIGDNYRGVILPVRWTRDEPNVARAGAAPDSVVYDPGLPPAPKNVDSKGAKPTVIQMPLPTDPEDEPGNLEPREPAGAKAGPPVFGSTDD